jgi:hypothetical protein
VEPGQQGVVALAGGGELGIGEVPAQGVDDGRVVGVGVGVDAVNIQVECGLVSDAV